MLFHIHDFLDVLEEPAVDLGEQVYGIDFEASAESVADVKDALGAGARFDTLLDACEIFASSRGASVEAGMNLARVDAYRRMRSHGYRVALQGVAMQRPHVEGFNRPSAYVIDDWR